MTSKILHSGYDSFTPNPGEWDHLVVCCKACDTLMDVRKNCTGPTSSIMAMAGSTTQYDHYTCPHSGESWHNEVIDLFEEMRDFKSKTFKKIVLSEIQEILQNNNKNVIFLDKEDYGF
mgnify:FL=1